MARSTFFYGRLGGGWPLASLMSSCALLAALAAPACASPLLLDWSPAALGIAPASGDERDDRAERLYRSYADTISFATDTFVDGIDIYTTGRRGAVGTPVTVTIWADRAGGPGDMVGQFRTALSAVDDVGATAGNRRAHADFTGFTMLADTVYWIGMAGRKVELAQLALLTGAGDGRMAQIGYRDGYAGDAAGDMAFRLYGVASPAAIELPEPDSLPLVAVAGLALLAAQLRRRR